MVIELQPPQVELHRWDADNIELTEDCQQIGWSWSVDPMWHTITLKLAIPRRRWRNLPRPGDWLVIRHGHDGLAEAFGYVHDRSWGVYTQADGHVKSDVVNVSAIGFFDLFDRMQTYVAPGLNSDFRRGTLMSLKQWFSGPWNAFKKTLSAKVRPGAILTSVARQLGQIKVPDTIADEYIGRALRYAYDANTRSRYCNERPLEPILGPSLNGFQAGFTTSATVLGLLRATFLADMNLTEMFPSLERVDSKWMSTTGRVLGTQPVVIYRMRPYAASSLAKYARQASKRNKSSRTPYSSNMFRQAPWDVKGAVRIPAEAVTRITGSRSDVDHVNTVTVGLPMQQDSVTRFMDKAGLPLYASKAIQRRGVRMFQPNWPFFPPGKDGELIPHTRAVAGRAWQFQAGADRFERGSVECAYIRAVRHGALVDVEVPAEIDGRSSPGSLVAYTNRVTHTWECNRNAAWSSRTSIDYTRGLFDETEREIEFPEAESISVSYKDENPGGVSSGALQGAVSSTIGPGKLSIGGS